jgi:membrane-associated protein
VLTQLFDLLLHADVYLQQLVATYGPWIYGILFAIVFAETGLVVTPFLPGDSLLFAAGALAGSGSLNPTLTVILLIAAAISGDAVNYSIGRAAGTRIIQRSRVDPRWGRWIKPAYVDRAHEFFERQGGKAIVLARFVPIVRTFVPFVAGVAEMNYPAFALYNVAGAVGWVAICVGAGYLFGQVPIVRENFSLVALGIVFVSLLPMLFEYLRHRSRTREGGSERARGRPPSS